ncbi:MAG: hypothetical protein ACPLEW_09645 [Pseudothermotoga sp.]
MDGFRFDVVNMFCKDIKFRNNLTEENGEQQAIFNFEFMNIPAFEAVLFRKIVEDTERIFKKLHDILWRRNRYGRNDNPIRENTRS